MSSYIIVALGGMAGAMLRHFITSQNFFSSEKFWLNIFFVNIIGSAIFGLCVAFLEQRLANDQALRFFLLTGLLGSFTTFSTFSFDLFYLLSEGRILHAAQNILGQIVLSVIFLAAFWKLGLAIFAR